MCTHVITYRTHNRVIILNDRMSYDITFECVECFLSPEFKDSYTYIYIYTPNVNIPFHKEPVATNPSETNTYARAARASELLRRSLSDPKRLLMSRRSENDKLLRRVSQRANIFPENAGRSLCSLFLSPVRSRVLIFHGFQLCERSADEIAE